MSGDLTGGVEPRELTEVKPKETKKSIKAKPKPKPKVATKKPSEKSIDELALDYSKNLLKEKLVHYMQILTLIKKCINIK